MSNIELVKKFYALFREDDRQGYLSLCDDGIVWHTKEGMPAGGRYVSKRAAFEEYFPKMLANFTQFHATAEEYLDAGDSVIVLGKYSGSSKAGRKFEAPFAHIFSIKASKIVSFRQYTDTALIRQAMAPG